MGGLAVRVGVEARVLDSERMVGDDVDVVWSQKPVWMMEHTIYRSFMEAEGVVQDDRAGVHDLVVLRHFPRKNAPRPSVLSTSP